MKKILGIAFLMAVMIAVSGGSFASANDDHPKKKMPEFKQVELTEDQVQELKTMHEDLVNMRAGIINKYVEYGVLSEEDAANMKEHLNKYMEKMEEDSFIPNWDKHHKHHKNDAGTE